jgi:hypothetical protein
MTDPCPSCDRPTPTSELLTHGSGCHCDGCEAACFGRCEPHDWRGEALRLREDVARLQADVARGMKLANAVTLETQTVEEACAELVRLGLVARKQRDEMWDQCVTKDAAERALRADVARLREAADWVLSCMTDAKFPGQNAADEATEATCQLRAALAATEPATVGGKDER